MKIMNTLIGCLDKTLFMFLFSFTALRNKFSYFIYKSNSFKLFQSGWKIIIDTLWLMGRHLPTEIKKLLSMLELFLKLLIMLNLFSLSLSHNVDDGMSRALSDIIDEFYIKNNISFDIIIYGKQTSAIRDVVDDLLKYIDHN